MVRRSRGFLQVVTMPDDIDRAQDRAEEYTQDCLAEQHHQAEQAGPAATGACLFCGARLLAARRWCNAACRDDWEHEQQLIRLRGAA